MTRPRASILLVAVLALGALFRLQGVNWDAHHHLHPDERFISMVEEKLVTPKSLGEYFDSAHSGLNPYNRGHGSFVYGTLPMLLARSVVALVGKRGYDGTFLVGRVLSALFDLLSVWLVYRIVRRFAARRTALVGACLLAFAPLAIQLSHFWTVDTFLTTFSTAALLCAVRLAQGKSRWREFVLTGLAVGLAVACKITGLALLLPVGVSWLLGSLPASGLPPAQERRDWAVARLARIAMLLVAAAVTVRIAFPYAFLGKSFLSFRLDPRWVADLKGLTGLARSVAAFPPNFQWAGRTVLFPLKNIVLWGAAPLFGLAALAALGWGAVAVWKRKSSPLAPLLLHALFLMAYHGLTMAKSMRYLYPVYPTLAALAALFLATLAGKESASPLARWRRWLPAVAVAATFLCGLAFTSIYRREHTRVAASRWIYQNVPPGKRFVNETWDDGLPLPMEGFDAGQYGGPQPNVVGPDNAAKAEEIVKALEEADGVAITSNRAYGSLTRIPDVFPMTRAYYAALFEGRLGFRCVADFTSHPALGPLTIPDDSAEEVFTVYDHPRVLLFRKTPEFSARRVRGMLLAAIPETPPTLNAWEKWPRARRTVSDPVRPPRRAELERKRDNMESLEAGSVGAALTWYLALLALGVCAMPIAFLLFPRLSDRGLGFARILGVLLPTYLLTLTVNLRLAQNGRGAALLCFLAVAATGAAVFASRRRTLTKFLHEKGRMLLQSEAVFAFGFLLFLAFRAANPEIVWGEKPMDFSILNILVRTRTLPASDPWFAGAPLGYYTFGQEMIAFLTLVTGLSTRYTFNLAFGLLGGVTLQGAFSLARSWVGTLRAGVAAASFVGLLGNLAGLREWWTVRRLQHLPLDWHYFWATSRVIKDTINEYPFWSLLFADLHAHVLAMPLFLLVAASALTFVRAHADPASRERERLLAGILLGFSAAVQALTNAWDVPFLLGLLLLVAIVATLAAGRLSLRSTLQAVLGLSVAALSGLAAALPLWVRGGGPPGHGWNAEKGAAGADVLTMFGFFFFLAFAWWLVSAAQRLRERGIGPAITAILVLSAGALLVPLGFACADALCLAGILAFLLAAFWLADAPEDRLAFGFVATGFFLILFTQRAYIFDRMNTFFKLYFESWLVFSIGTAALVFRAPARRGAFARWPLLPKALFFLLLLATLFTTLTAGRGALTEARPTYRGPLGGLTLDGLRHLESSNPGEYRAVLWLRRALRSTPVVLEAQGPSYQEFGRISMLTGLPTVLGWEYHVQQRGNSGEEIAARRAAVQAIYSNPNADAIEVLLRRHHVGYVYVGWLERKTYPAAGLRKFETAKELFQVAYENPGTKIYRVIGGDSEDVVLPAKESLLPQAPGAPPAEILEPEETPSIEETAAPGRPPFSGMREPRDAAVDERGRLWVADFGNSRLRIFDSQGGYLGGWGGRGSGTYGFNQLCGVSIRGEDLYVADTWNGRIQFFTLAGEWKATASGLYGPRGVAAAADGKVWVTDTGNHRVLVYDSQLNTLKSIGKKGGGPEEFSGPVGIAVGPSGFVSVVDVGNRRIEVLDSNGRFVRAWPVVGWDNRAEPHLEVGDDETVYLTDPTGDAVFEFDPSGRPRNRWTNDSAGKKFSRPTGIALDQKTRILYVVNSGNHSVSRIALSNAKTR